MANVYKIVFLSLLTNWECNSQLLLPFSGRFGDLLKNLKHLDTSDKDQSENYPDGNPPWRNPKSAFPFSKTEGPISKTKPSKIGTQSPINSRHIPNRRGPPPALYLPTFPTQPTFRTFAPSPTPSTARPFIGVRQTSSFVLPPRGTIPRSFPPPRRPFNAVTAPSPSRTSKNDLSGCRPGQRCEVHMKSFETASEVLQYAYSHSSALPPVMQAILDETQSGRLPPPLQWNQTISPEVVQYTMNVMRAVRPNRALIVGVFTGLSVVGAATTINNRGLVIGVEYPEYLMYWEKIGNKYAQQAELMSKIQLRTEFPIPDALDQIAKQEPGSFDFILLDDIAQENYMLDYERCLSLLRSGGVLLINDFLVGGEVLSGPNMQSPAARTVAELNRKIQKDVRVQGSFIPIGGGLIMIYKK